MDGVIWPHILQTVSNLGNNVVDSITVVHICPTRLFKKMTKEKRAQLKKTGKGMVRHTVNKRSGKVQVPGAYMSS